MICGPACNFQVVSSLQINWHLAFKTNHCCVKPCRLVADFGNSATLCRRFRRLVASVDRALRPNPITSICGGFDAQKSTTNRSNGVWANSLIRFILMLKQVSMLLTQMNGSRLTLWPWPFDRTIGTCGISWSQNYYKLWKQSYPPIYQLRRIMSLSCMRSGDLLTSDLLHQLLEDAASF